MGYALAAAPAARASRFFTVLLGCAPFLIHSCARSTWILMVGGLVSGL